jgi:hypothetical protein
MNICLTRYGFPYSLNYLMNARTRLALFSGIVPTSFDQLTFNPENSKEVWDNCLGLMNYKNVSSMDAPKLLVELAYGSFTDNQLYKGSYFLSDTSMYGNPNTPQVTLNAYVSCLRHGIRAVSKYGLDADKKKYFCASQVSSSIDFNSQKINIMNSTGDYFEVDLDPSNITQGLIIGWEHSSGAYKNMEVFAVLEDGSEIKLFEGNHNSNSMTTFLGSKHSPANLYYFNLSDLITADHVKLKFVSLSSGPYNLYQCLLVTNQPFDGFFYDPQKASSAVSMGKATWGLILDENMEQPFGLVDIGIESSEGNETVKVKHREGFLHETLGGLDVPPMGLPEIDSSIPIPLQYGGSP